MLALAWYWTILWIEGSTRYAIVCRTSPKSVKTDLFTGHHHHLVVQPSLCSFQLCHGWCQMSNLALIVLYSWCMFLYANKQTVSRSIEFMVHICTDWPWWGWSFTFFAFCCSTLLFSSWFLNVTNSAFIAFNFPSDTFCAASCFHIERKIFTRKATHVVMYHCSWIWRSPWSQYLAISTSWYSGIIIKGLFDVPSHFESTVLWLPTVSRIALLHTSAFHFPARNIISR